MATEYNWAGSVREGGRWFKELRLKRDVTLRDVDRATGVAQQNISSLENGLIVKPAMAMLVTLGAYYGVTPNEIARRFGWWAGPDSTEKPRDERIAYLEAVVERLPVGARYTLLQQVAGLAKLAEQEAIK